MKRGMAEMLKDGVIMDVVTPSRRASPRLPAPWSCLIGREAHETRGMLDLVDSANMLRGNNFRSQQFSVRQTGDIRGKFVMPM